MKKIILGLLMISCFAGSAQSRIKFAYDEAGNQIRRYIQIGNTSAKSNEEYKTVETLTEVDMIKDTEYEQISYYPNPVKEELYVNWKNQDNNVVATIEIYTMNGQLMKAYQNMNTKNNETIPFQAYPDGFYNLILVYTNGERKTLKIVKN